MKNQVIFESLNNKDKMEWSNNFKRIMIKSMRGKLFKILGVVAVIAMFATTVLVAPVAAISGVALTGGRTEIN